LHNSVVELFHDQITRFRPIMIIEPSENPFEVLARGETPSLSALRLHNGTVWRWNRACYGVTEGVPHLRIENRALPSGPTVTDEIANAAFFTGLMVALPEVYGDVTKRMEFDDAKLNFFRAARHGLDAQFRWIDGESHSAPALILDHLLPLARQGLTAAGVATEDTDKYLDIVEQRAQSRQTGATWIAKSIAAMDNSTSKDTRQRKLTSAMLANQKNGAPVHHWSIIKEAEPDEWEDSYRTIGQFMSTDLFTVKPGDLIDLAASVMDWRHIRHVPVEDDEGRLIGLVTHRGLLRILNLGNRGSRDAVPITVREVMIESPVTVSPSTSSLEAINIMRSNRVGCLPVVDNDQLVGIVTSYDFLEASARLFQQHLAAPVDERKSRAAGAQGAQGV
jgi:CBS domain-containing protein